MSPDSESSDISGDFKRLGEAIRIKLFLGRNPESVGFQVEIVHHETGDIQTIEYFALPDIAMALLKMLQEVQQHEGYQIPAGSMRKTPIQ